jgi:hypothetical protein
MSNHAGDLFVGAGGRVILMVAAFMIACVPRLCHSRLSRSLRLRHRRNSQHNPPPRRLPSGAIRGWSRKSASC